MRLIFMGTPALAIPSLEALMQEHEIVLVVTQPDKPAGRGHKLVAPPVKEFALRHNIPVSQPEKARDAAFVSHLRELRPDAIAVVAYGQILPREILDLPRENFEHGGCVNLHFSLLPRWRGAAPVQYALLHGDAKTGVTTQWMAEKLDAGDVILQREVALSPEETAAELFTRLTPLGAEVLRETMRLMQNGKAPRTPQSENDATYAPTIKKEDARIDWTKSATEISNQIRAFNPRPLAWCEFRGEALKVWRAQLSSEANESTRDGGKILNSKNEFLVATGDGVLSILKVQPSGKPKMSALDWARGARLEAGEKLE
jgi:methionyl-tRNA formyltransferase